MVIEKFTESDIGEAAGLAYPVWGAGHADNGPGEKFGLLMCEYIVRYGWYGAPYAFKLTDGAAMKGFVLAGDISRKNGYNEWLDSVMPILDDSQKREATVLRDYFDKTTPRVHGYMNAADDLYLSFFLSSVRGGGKLLLNEVVSLARTEGYKNLYLWTDSSCNHEYYACNRFELVAEFESNEWATDTDDYLTYIYRKVIE